MKDADRLIGAHGSGAHAIAMVGARANGETNSFGTWSSVAREIKRRNGDLVPLSSRCL